ncbi:MAG: glycosyltransferase [Nitrospirae bacterium]|nr:glycosyltransferase [Nitrospirota bacterium]
MILNNKLIVVMPAYNAEKTLRRTYQELPFEYVDDVILVDDASKDSTVKVAAELGVKTIIHRENMGYGANQKTCYRLDNNSDDFVFDNEILVQAIYLGFKIGEISCPTRYFEEASSINFLRSIKYGTGVIAASIKYLLQKTGIMKISLFRK